MSFIEIETIKVTTAGGAGAATGETDSLPINGFLLDVFIDYDAAAPATTDVIITDAVFGDLVTKSDNATRVHLAPRLETCDKDAVASGMYDLHPIHAGLTVQVEDADAITDCVTVTIRWLRP